VAISDAGAVAVTAGDSEGDSGGAEKYRCPGEHAKHLLCLSLQGS